MWIVSVDTDFYPYIKKYKTYEEALEEYEYQRKKCGDDDCVFLSEVRKYTKGEDYDIDKNIEFR
jgi:ribosomal protein S17